jgi:hypothetical protein
METHVNARRFIAMLTRKRVTAVIQLTVKNLFVCVPLVLYGCETWSLTLKEEHRLRVFENRVLRRIFGTKRDEVT